MRPGTFRVTDSSTTRRRSKLNWTFTAKRSNTYSPNPSAFTTRRSHARFLLRLQVEAVVVVAAALVGAKAVARAQPQALNVAQPVIAEQAAAQQPLRRHVKPLKKQTGVRMPIGHCAAVRHKRP